MNSPYLKGDAIALLQQWYASQCNGNWEHSYGVRIDTLDNPGWILTVDLDETVLSGISVHRDRIDRSDMDWAQHEVSGNKFIACGRQFNLEELIWRFLTVLQQASNPTGSDEPANPST